VNDLDIFNSKASLLAEMMGLGKDDRELWKPEELEAMLEHQLSAPVEFDFSSVDVDLARFVPPLGSTEGPPIRSFKDLLHHPCPPVQLLESTKEFARACRKSPDCLLPDGVAAVLYLLSIVVALTKCERRISKLDDQALRYSLDWALDQSWVDESTRELLREGYRVIGCEEPESDA